MDINNIFKTSRLFLKLAEEEADDSSDIVIEKDADPSDVDIINELLADHWDDDIKGTTVTIDDLKEVGDYVVIFTDHTLQYIKSKHRSRSSPGSYIDPAINIKSATYECIAKNAPLENSEKYASWQVNMGKTIGFMGVSKTKPEELLRNDKFKKNTVTFPTSNDKIKTETFYVTHGNREPSDILNLITYKCGSLPSGKEVIFIVTMFPGGSEIGGEAIPRERSEFAEKGFYFVVE